MDWLRSEDLKEEMDVTTPITILAGKERSSVTSRRFQTHEIRAVESLGLHDK